MPKYFILRCTIIICLSAVCTKVVVAQEAKVYFNKISAIVAGNNSASHIYKSLDSLMATRIQSRSSIELQIKRPLDAGFYQQRIKLKLNEVHYSVDLLTLNDSAYFSIISTNRGYLENDLYSYNKVVFDTLKTTEYLSKRNLIYHTRKSIEDMKVELALEKQYALYCGDGSPKTKEGIYIDKLVAKKEIDKLREMLQSINCETQGYGASGYDVLKKNGYKIAIADEQILRHIKKCNADLITCAGCFSGIIAKQYQ